MTPAMPPKEPVRFYFLDKHKLAIEVRAAGVLNRAVKDSANRLHDWAADVDPRLEFLANMLWGLDHEFSADQRGNARRLCSEVRLFAEAASSSVNSASFDSDCIELRRLTQWACHPPMTKSKLEYQTQANRPHGEGKPEFKAQWITEVDILQVAARLRRVVDGVLKQSTFCGGTPQWQQAPEESLEASRAALDEAVAKAKDEFARRRIDMKAGKHGKWDASLKPVCTFHKHALLLFESEEHLVASRHGSAQQDGDTLGARQLCLGIRMFAEQAGRDMFGMPLNHSGAGLREIHDLVDPMLSLTHWSAHAHTYPIYNRLTRVREATVTVDAAYQERVTVAFKDLSAACLGVLDFFAEPRRRAVLDLGERAAADWRVALYLGLMLKDHVKPSKEAPNDGAPSVVSLEATAEGLSELGVTNGLVGFYTIPMLPDSEKLLRQAETGSRAAVAECAVDDPGLDALLDLDAVAAKELEYVRDILKRARYDVAPVHSRTSRRKCSKEATLKTLGVELFGPSRPLTALELRAALAAARSASEPPAPSAADSST